MKMKKFILFIGVFLFFAVSAYAQEVSSQFNRKDATVGEIIEYTVTVTLPAGAMVLSNQNPSFVSFDILSFDVRHVSSDPNVFTITFNIAGYATGVLPIEPTAIFYLNADGTSNLFFTPATTFEIVSVLPPDKEVISDVKPLEKLPTNPLIMLMIAVGVIGLGIMAFYGYRQYKIAKQKPVYIDPQTAALQALEGSRETLLKTNHKMFYYAMSEILRGYISDKYKINAMEMTTVEFQDELAKIAPPEVSAGDIKEYLRDFDLARYAALSISDERNERNYNLTKMLVEKL